MKKENIKFIIMSVIVVCIVIAGILVPGIVLEAKQKSEYDKVAQVPKDYLPSSSVMAKEASANLKLSEKLSLIDGQWDSTTDEAASYEMDDQDYQAVATAPVSRWRNCMSKTVSGKFITGLFKLVYVGDNSL